MITVDWPCDLCRNRIGMIDGWKPNCKAFPDGILTRLLDVDVRDLPECANGYKWEPKEENKE